MTEADEVKRFAGAILELAIFLNINQTDAQLKLYALHVKRNISFQDFVSARGVYLDTRLIDRPANEEMYKTLAKIIEIAKPKANNEEKALAIANTIIGAVPRFGYTRAADARVSIGEIGWQVIQMRGGWEAFCKILSNSNTASLTAQIRDMVEAQLRSDGQSQFFGQLGPGQATAAIASNGLQKAGELLPSFSQPAKKIG